MLRTLSHAKADWIKTWRNENFQSIAMNRTCARRGIVKPLDQETTVHCPKVTRVEPVVTETSLLRTGRLVRKRL